MSEELNYEFSEQPLYTEVAVNYLQNFTDNLENNIDSDDSVGAPSYAVFVGELESLERYLEELQPYHTTLDQAYDDDESIPRPEVVLGRIEEDMDLMARERDAKLDDSVISGQSRRDVLNSILDPLESDRPVLADAWIIMNEASELRETH